VNRFLLIILFVSSSAYAQQRVQLGVNGGIFIFPINGAGFFFETLSDNPHDEKGYTGGLNALIPISKNIALLSYSNIALHQSHFHMANPYNESVYTGYFRILNIRQSVGFNYFFDLKISEKQRKLKIFGGLSANSYNLASPLSKQTDEFAYSSNVSTIGSFYPELFLGTGLVSRFQQGSNLHFEMSFNVLPLKQMVYDAGFEIEPDIDVSIRRTKGYQYLLFSIVFFPHIEYFKKRREWSRCE
jgi:hypothetical protein